MKVWLVIYHDRHTDDEIRVWTAPGSGSAMTVCTSS